MTIRLLVRQPEVEANCVPHWKLRSTRVGPVAAAGRGF